MNKLIVILGPTAAGKSELAVKLAKKFSGEIISADSRQVYQSMNIGTNKITKKEMAGIPHYLLDVVSPKTRFSVAQYRKLALKAIDRVFKKNKTPILCGGTYFYIKAVIDGLTIPQVKPDWQLRKNLGKKTAQELFQRLKKLDPKRAESIEKENKRRLIRALEIVIKTRKPVPRQKERPLPYPVLMIGVKKEKEELKKLIEKCLLKRLKKDMVSEVKKLKKNGLSWKRLEEFGLEYRWIARYLKSDFSNIDFRKSDFFNRLQKEIEHFAKKQMTWLKRDKRIYWVKNYKEAESLVSNKF